MLSAKAQVLLERVTKFYSSKHWQTDSCCREWLELIPLISKLELEEAVEAYEMLAACLLMAKSDSHHTQEDSQIRPLNKCLFKLKELITVGFWARIIEIELSAKNDDQAKAKVTELVVALPPFSRSALKQNRIDSVEFPLAEFASLCLKEPTPDKSRN